MRSIFFACLMAVITMSARADEQEYILNNSFEDGTTSWTCDGLSSQSNTSFTKKDGSKYLEKWVSQGNSVGSASVSQTVTLPNGVYKLTVAAQNLNQSATSRKCTGARIYAGSKEIAVYTPADYSVEFVSLTGKVVVGFEAVDATGNWLAVDNFRLTLVSEATADVINEEVARLISEGEALQSQMMYKAEATALASAIDGMKAISSSSAEADIAAAVEAIENAISSAKTAIADYQALQTTIADAQTYYDATKNGAEGFKVEIDKANVLVTNDGATKAELDEEIAALETALLAFHIANATAGTGTAPRVTTTNPYVATGATEALVRAGMTGSNILERGVCWSTEHNPTVLDNRSTKSFSLNGTIYHIQGMKPSTVYYVRPYVMNKTYTVAYGDEIKVVTHPAGGCTWSWNECAPDEAANTRCRNAIKETIAYFNEWTGIKGFHLSGNYGASTPTADCIYGGYMRIGPNSGNQAIGTVLHETGHGVGVGTHWRWYNCADTRSNTTYGKWLGRAATEVYQFLENKYTDEYYFQGDKTHGWGSNASYDWFVNGADKDKHSELQYIGGMCIMYGLFIDGLCPTANHHNGISGYTYNFDDSTKYYIMCKADDRGLGDGLLYQNRVAASWKPYFSTDTEVNDSAAWYMEFSPTLGYYSFKNVATGRYLTRSSSTMSTKIRKTPSDTEMFQLMPDRTDVTLGADDAAFTTHGYWFTWYDNGNKAMAANELSEKTGRGMVTPETFNFSDKATSQQWIIISENELDAYRKAAISTGIDEINTDGAVSGTGKVAGIYSIDGVKKTATTKGLNIIRYADGSVKKIYIR